MRFFFYAWLCFFLFCSLAIVGCGGGSDETTRPNIDELSTEELKDDLLEALTLDSDMDLSGVDQRITQQAEDRDGVFDALCSDPLLTRPQPFPSGFSVLPVSGSYNIGGVHVELRSDGTLEMRDTRGTYDTELLSLLWNECEERGLDLGTEPPLYSGRWSAGRSGSVVEVCLRMDIVPGALLCRSEDGETRIIQGRAGPSTEELKDDL